MMMIICTALALIAFAANSLLCRLALGGGLIDPISFTTVRLLSGTLVLFLVAHLVTEPKTTPTARGSWGSGLALFAYAAAFSLAYVSLTTGTGALILFGAVQITMISVALKSGDRVGATQWLGASIALGGLIYLMVPGIAAPDPLAAVLMGVAGIAWGVYSIRGKGAAAPIAMTAGNFRRSAPLVLVLMVGTVVFSFVHLQPAGILLALLSGMVTSGLGYVIWYTALNGLSTTQASVVQLLVPVVAALGGILFLAEPVSLRLIGASALILGGVALALVKRTPKPVGG